MTLRGLDKNYSARKVDKLHERLQKNLSSNDISSTKLGVYDRLFRHHTLNSIRRSYSALDSGEIIPNDSLDFALSSIYIHSEDCNVPKSYTSMQPKTLNIPSKNFNKNVSSRLFGRDNVRNKNKEAMGLMEEIDNQPKIVIATSLTPMNKTKTYKLANNYVTVSRRNGDVSEHSVLRKSTLQKQYDTSLVREKNSNSLSNKTLPSTCMSEYFTKDGKTQTLIKQCDEFSLTKRNGTIIGNENSMDKARRNKGEINSAKKSESSIRDVKSGVMMTRSHDVAYTGMENDVFDKTRRRETYAAQMRAIERIHPSSLRLAVDGPHSDQTNPGYSRKIDGTFYGV